MPVRLSGCAAALVCFAMAACAPAERVAPGDRPAPIEDAPADSVIVPDEEDESPEGVALLAAEEAWLAGDYGAAIELTDSLSAAWSRQPGVDERPVRRLARLLLARAEDVEAVDQLLYHPSALDESWREAMRGATERMSIAELDDLSRRISRDEQALGIVRAEHARALALSGDDEQARQIARELDDAELHDADRRKIEDVLAGRIEPSEARIRIGFVVPRSGGFEPVGDQLIEGARLAARHYESRSDIPVELLIVDEAVAVDSAGLDVSALVGGAGARQRTIFERDEADAGADADDAGGIRIVGGAPDPDDSDGDAEADARAEDRERDAAAAPYGGAAASATGGLAAVIGPVMSEALRAAARARGAPGLLLLSPTASEDSALAPHAYSLWDRARRDSLEATTLANWMISAFESGGRVGALHPDDASGHRRSRVFREAVEGAGFEWVGAEPYQADSTTHQEEIAALTEADPDFVYTIADGPRQVLQVAPQLHFYGLRGRITLVNQDWTHPVVIRRLDEPFSDYRVAAVYFEREGNQTWERFASAWDEEYRRSLPDNAFAALGYDAVSLVLGALPDPTLVRSAAVARALTRLRNAEGATGSFTFDPESRRLTRSARVRMILRSELTDPDPQAIIDWSIETREQEEQRLEREAQEEARRRGGSP